MDTYYIKGIIFSLAVISIAVCNTRPVYAQTQGQSYNVTVSAQVGTPILELYGYSSPFADVGLFANPGSTSRVFADQNGYFEFNDFYITSQTREICLDAIDREKRTTNPVCIPSPGVDFTEGKIGPVILPPSISLENGSFFIDSTVAAQGESIPNSTITISFFKSNPSLLTKTFDLIVPKAYAVSLPEYTLETDDDGRYSFNLPSSTASQFRVFSQTSFNSSPSPKSNTLTFTVFTFLRWLIQEVYKLILLFIAMLKNFPIVEAVILLQLLFLAYFFYTKRKRNIKLMVIEKKLAKYNNGIQNITSYPSKPPSPPSLTETS